MSFGHDLRRTGDRSVTAGGNIGTAITGDNNSLIYQMAAARPVVPRQLPAAPADFTGRVRELRELLDRCSGDAADRSPVVIAGLAGVGKSALALRLAHEMAEAYPDGQLYVGLRGQEGPLAPEMVLPGFLRALGTAPGDVPVDPAEQAALFRSLLADRKVLLVLDDAASEQQVRPLLPGASSCLVLITSRNPLPALPGATTLLGLLDPVESLALLGAVAGADRVAADNASSERIVELCGRLPLALRIAAARLRARTDWTPAHLSARLSDAKRRLRELRIGDLDVRATFQLSYRDLPDDAARLFRYLAATPGPTFGIDLLARILNTAEADAEELLDRLLFDQLVESADMPGRYRLHDLMRQLAVELLTEHHSGDRATALEAMFEWYREKTMVVISALLDSPANRISSSGSSEESLSWLDAEESTLVCMLEHSDHARYDDYTMTMARTIITIARSRAMWAIVEAACEYGLAAARRLSDRDGEGQILAELAASQYVRDFRSSAAIESLARAVELLDPQADPDFCRALRLELARLYHAAGRSADAERENAAAVAISKRIDASDDLDADLPEILSRALTLISKRRSRKAVDLLLNAVSEWEALPPILSVPLLTTLGMAYYQGGQATEAAESLEHGLSLARHYGFRGDACKMLELLGRTYRSLGRDDDARRVWEQGLLLMEGNQHAYEPSLVGHLMFDLADHLSKYGEHSEADRLFGTAVEAFERAGAPQLRVLALARQAQEKTTLNDPDGALSALLNGLTAPT
ncbi:ATP-binding protein [Actinomadura citrea]|uniref:ATP-binding protein n=1 Tax=Actinomadura citrea TaxID=46158 RepID=UPI002E2D7A98|nr:ATP-binding protein [Actinomadura citrea]